MRGRLLVGRVRGIIGRPFAYMRAEWDRMAPRERTLVAALGGAVMLIGTALVVLFVVDTVSDLSQHNADVREALAAIVRERDEYLDAKSRSAAQEARIGVDPPQLQVDLEQAARKAGIQIPESNERPVTPVGRRFAQHDVDLKLRQVDLQSLTGFLKSVETAQRLILVTRLSLKRRYSETDKLDAEITATAFERVKDAPKKKPGPGTGKKEP